MNISKLGKNKILAAILVIMAMLVTNPALAIKSVSVYALFKDRAILLIDGQRHMLRAGETSPEGLKLVTSNTRTAIIEIDGNQEVIGLNINPATEPMHVGNSSSERFDTTVTLNMAYGGFFHADGEINNKAVTFLVDTGANVIAMNESTARRLDIDYKSGKKSLARTASGYASMHQIVLDKVTVGAIEASNVEAAVIQDPGPDGILLGMSFLSQLEMKRSGATMELIQR